MEYEKKTMRVEEKQDNALSQNYYLKNIADMLKSKIIYGYERFVDFVVDKAVGNRFSRH